MSASPGHVAVVGAGVFGAASAFELAARGWRVSLVEPGPIPRPEASSTDVSKLVRMEYGSDVFYHELAEAALEGWRRWNADWPRPLYHQDGLLVLSRGPMRAGGFEHESWRVLQARGYAPERLDEASLRKRFPAWRGDAFADGFFNAVAGWAESGEVVSHLLSMARAAGAQVLSARAEEVRAGGSRTTGLVLAGGAELAADRVVVATGAWTPALLPWLTGVLRPTAQPVLYFAAPDPDAYRPPRFPPWAADIAGTGWYGFPALADGRVKVGHHGPGRGVAPDERGEADGEHERRCRTFLRDAIPGLADAPLVGSRVCMYCDSFDGDLLLAEDPDREGLVLATGGSGHGFKFAPVLGALVADVVERKEGRWAQRFAWRSASVARSEEARFDGRAP